MVYSAEVLYIFLFLLYVSRPFEIYTDRICSFSHRKITLKHRPGIWRNNFRWFSKTDSKALAIYWGKCAKWKLENVACFCSKFYRQRYQTWDLIIKLFTFSYLNALTSTLCIFLFAFLYWCQKIHWCGKSQTASSNKFAFGSTEALKMVSSSRILYFPVPY